jgi:hypothetical protein
MELSHIEHIGILEDSLKKEVKEFTILPLP